MSTPPDTADAAVLALGYSAANDTLGAQADTLSSLRNRATALLSASALITTFVSSVGALNSDPSKGPVLPAWIAVTLFLLLILIGFCALAVNWPVRGWRIRIAPEKFLEHQSDGSIDFYREAIVQLDGAIDRNEWQIWWRSISYRAAIALLLVQAGVLATRFLGR